MLPFCCDFQQKGHNKCKLCMYMNSFLKAHGNFRALQVVCKPRQETVLVKINLRLYVLDAIFHKAQKFPCPSFTSDPTVTQWLLTFSIKRKHNVRFV